MGYKSRRKLPKRSRAVMRGLLILADMIEDGRPPSRDDRFYVAAAIKWVRNTNAYDHGLPPAVADEPEPEDCPGGV